MKFVDNVPIFIVIAALLINIAVGAAIGIDFTALMIRCMVVTVVFGTFGYLITETVKNALECSKFGKLSKERNNELEGQGKSLNIDSKEPIINIEVPSLNDDEFITMVNGSEGEFVEMNPAYMGNYDQDKQG